MRKLSRLNFLETFSLCASSPVNQYYSVFKELFRASGSCNLSHISYRCKVICKSSAIFMETDRFVEWWMVVGAGGGSLATIFTLSHYFMALSPKPSIKENKCLDNHFMFNTSLFQSPIPVWCYLLLPTYKYCHMRHVGIFRMPDIIVLCDIWFNEILFITSTTY